MAASEVMTSGTGAGEERRSDSQMESMSLFSQNSARVKRNCPLSRPGGQGPGMIPMRYLVPMGSHPIRPDLVGQGRGVEERLLPCLTGEPKPVNLVSYEFPYQA